MNAKISVIVAVYNTMDYLDECLESLTEQTYKNLEIVLVDDGSTDDSGRKCDIWESRDSRIRVIHQKNMGISKARNAGLKIITGDYVAFLDSDDLLNKFFYEKMLDALYETGADMALCKVRPFEFKSELEKENIKENKKLKYKKEVVEENKKIKNKNEMCSYYISEDKNRFIYHLNDSFTGEITWVWNKLYKREVLNNVTFKNIKVMEDVMFITDVLTKVKSCVWVLEPLHYYRQRNGSIMNSGLRNIYEDYARSLEYEFTTLKYIKDRKFQEKHLYSCLNKIASYDVRAYENKMYNEDRKMLFYYKTLYMQNKKLVTDNKEKLKIFLFIHMHRFYCWLKKIKNKGRTDGYTK